MRGIFVGVIAGAALLIAFGYREATRDPILRTTTFKNPGTLGSGPPVRVLLMSDAHVEAPETTPRRLARIVQQANSLHPDIVVIAGDFRGDSVLATKRYTIE